jgi:hypothetical protein
MKLTAPSIDFYYEDWWNLYNDRLIPQDEKQFNVVKILIRRR